MPRSLFEPLRRASPKRPDETWRSYGIRVREAREASIQAQKSRWLNRCPTPDDSESSEDSDSSSSEPFKLEWWHVGLSRDDPRLIYYGVEPGPPLIPPPRPIRARPLKQCCLADGELEHLIRCNLIERPTEEERKQPCTCGPYTYYDDDDDDEQVGEQQQHVRTTKRKRTSSDGDDDTDDSDDSDGSNDSDGDNNNNGNPKKQGARAIKRRRILDNDEGQGQHQRGNGTAGEPTSRKRTREPEEDACVGETKRRRITTSAALWYHTTDHSSHSTQRSSGGADMSTTRKRSREPDLEEDECGEAKRRRVKRATISSPPISRPIRQSRQRCPPPIHKPKPQLRHDIAPPTQQPKSQLRHNIAPAHLAPPIAPPPRESVAPVSTRRQTRSSKTVVLLELDSRGKSSVQIPRSSPTINNTHDSGEGTLDEADKEPRPSRQSKASRPRKVPSTAGVQKKRCPRVKTKP